MNNVIACIDGAASTVSVCDHAAWAAKRLAAPLEFLHVIDRHTERAPVADFSGSIGLGAQEALLQELGALDEKRSALAQRHGRELLNATVALAKAAGVTDVTGVQRHGELVDSLLDIELQTRLFVLGKHPHAKHSSRMYLDHNVERTIRAVQRPVLVAAEKFKAPTQFAIAFDGSPTSRRTVEAVAASPLLAWLPCHVVTAKTSEERQPEEFEWASRVLSAAGFLATFARLPSEPEDAIPQYLQQHDIDLLVIGAYGHSRIRHLIVGSTTTALLRVCSVPVLVVR